MTRKSSKQAAYDKTLKMGAADRVLTPLDEARHRARRSNVVHPLVRALCVEDVHVQRNPDDSLAYSVAADDTRYLHVYSSPMRLGAALGVGQEAISYETMRLADALGRLKEGTCVRLDPDTETEVVLGPDLVRLFLGTAAGVPTPAALTAGEGEQLLFRAGPTPPDEADRAVRAALPGSLRRFTAELDGLGGRVWPVYLVSSGSLPLLEVAARAEDAAGTPVAVLVDGGPTWLADLLAPGTHLAVDVTA